MLMPKSKPTDGSATVYSKDRFKKNISSTQSGRNSFFKANKSCISLHLKYYLLEVQAYNILIGYSTKHFGILGDRFPPL